MKADEAGRVLAERHRSLAGEASRVVVDRATSLLNFSEVTYEGDWSLRSALCRLAQPEPARVGRVLESIRRLEVVLHHAQQPLERNGAHCLRPTGALTTSLDEPSVEAETVPDVRTADLARLVESGFEVEPLLSGYEAAEGVESLSSEERVAVPLLAIAVRFEDLAATLTSWADQGPGNRPVTAFDEACDEIEARLEQLGVPRETGGPPRGGRSRRSG